MSQSCRSDDASPTGAIWPAAAIWPATLAHLDTWRVTARDGALRLLFVTPPSRVCGAFDVAEGVDAVDELLLRYLQDTIETVGTAGAVLVVSRPTGRPRRSDRRLWASLASRFGESPVHLVDLLVVGPREAWSARQLGPRRSGPVSLAG